MVDMCNNGTEFMKGTERLVDPIEVGSIHFIQGLNKLLPKSLQEYLSKQSSKTSKYMGFVVEPYCSFLFYKITDLEKAKDFLPEGFKLIKTKIFADDEPDYYAILGSFRVHTSAFWGSRIEFYLIAENEATGMLSWVILEYDSNTIGQDKKYGLRDPSAPKAVITINHRGTVVVDVNNPTLNRKIAYNFDVNSGVMSPLDERLWIEGNLSVTHGKELNGSAKDVFALNFEPCEMEKALKIAPENIDVIENSWYKDIIERKPVMGVCFPYAQHFLSETAGNQSNIRNKEDLTKALSKLDFNSIKAFSVKPLRDMILMQNVVTTAMGLIILILLYLLMS